jgi:glycosyltransferase involved in cell wall biosynthesis
MQNRFSIILPVRNGGEFVKECVHSILHQEYPSFNLIVLDNCSKDGTREWIESLADNRIIIYPSPESLSIEKNWDRIKDISKNEFMTMIGHDDLLHHGYLKEMDELIRKHPDASLYQTHFDYIDANGKFIRDCIPMHETQYAHEFLALEMTRKMDSTGTGYMMRARDFDALGGMPVEYPNLIFSDYQLWVNLIRLGYKATSEKKCFSYRLNQSVSRTTNGMAYQQAFCRYTEFIISLAQKDELIKETTRLYGKDFLLYYCEALSHRILKTPIGLRTIKVADFIKTCESLAKRLIPGQDFKPLAKFRIWSAKQIDQTSPGRRLFQLFRKL